MRGIARVEGANEIAKMGYHMLDGSHTNSIPENSRDAIAQETQLLVGEMTHRVVNEYSMAISSLSLAASRSTNPEARANILQATTRLRDFAEAHRALQIPVMHGPIDLLESLGQICRTISRASLDERGISLTLTGASIALEATRCWRIGLIISELITNAARHGLSGRSGAIVVSIEPSGGDVCCRVVDNGASTFSPRLGRGSAVIGALAAQLGGEIKRQFTRKGTVAVLTFPNRS
jgi:two-component sensor histidine kinase